MADSGKIYITISDTRNGSGGGKSPDAPQQPNDDKEKTGLLSDYIRHRFFNFVEAQAKQAVNYSISNIGNFTGNYQAQRDMEQTMSAINWLITTAVATGRAAIKYGVAGGAIALAVSVGSGLINAGYREYTEQFQNRKDNRNIEMMRNRLGLQGLTDGSRTGGY